MKANLSLLLLAVILSDALSPLEASSLDHLGGGTRHPLAIDPMASEKETLPRRGPAIISESLATESFRAGNHFYFSYRLDGRTFAFRIEESRIKDGAYLLSHAGDSQLMVSIDRASTTPVFVERNLVSEDLAPIAADAVQPISWQEYLETSPAK